MYSFYITLYFFYTTFLKSALGTFWIRIFDDLISAKAFVEDKTRLTIKLCVIGVEVGKKPI